MLRFLDGPAAGKTLMCARAPIFLRVTETEDGTFDALDQLTDTPEPGERIHVYRMAEDHGMVHFDGRDRQGRRFGRTEQCADYRLNAEQPDDATARDTALWRAWCQAHRPPRQEAPQDG